MWSRRRLQSTYPRTAVPANSGFGVVCQTSPCSSSSTARMGASSRAPPEEVAVSRPVSCGWPPLVG